MECIPQRAMDGGAVISSDGQPLCLSVLDNFCFYWIYKLATCLPNNQKATLHE